ncbi:MAG: TolC family protein [Acidobacteriota bacterium]
MPTGSKLRPCILAVVRARRHSGAQAGLLLTLAFLLTAGIANRAWAQAPTLRLDDAVRLALANNRSLALAAQDVEKADTAVAVAKIARLPRFGVSLLAPVVLTHLDLRLGPLGTLDLPASFGLAIGTIAQPISQLYDIGLGVKASELNKDIAAERLRGARQAAVDQIKRAYYGCLRAESGLIPSREALTLFKEVEGLMANLVGERVALEADRLDVRARRAQQEHDILVLENALATGREQINVALGRDPGTPFSLETLPVAIPAEADMPAVLSVVLDRRPDVREARITIDLAKTDWRLKKAEQYPHVSALFGYIGNINMPLLPGNIASAVIQASWEPFDWGRKGRELAAKQVAMQQAQTQLRQVEATVAVDLKARARALTEARSLVSVAELTVTAARERLRVMLERRNEDAILAKDLLQAQVAVAEAVHKHQAALLTYWEARADFEKAMAIEP